MIQTILLGTLLSLIPVALRLIGIFPENGRSAVFWILMIQGFFASMVWVMVAGIWRSMVADLVEPEQLETGQRSEGSILSVMTFTGKAAGAFGIWLAGAMLDLAAFPTDAAVGELSASALLKLGWIYGPVLMLFYLVAAYFVSRYKFCRAEHSAVVEALARR